MNSTLNKSVYFCGNLIPRNLPKNLLERIGNESSAASNIFYNSLLNGIAENGIAVFSTSFVQKDCVNDCDTCYKGLFNLRFASKSRNLIIAIWDMIWHSYRNLSEFKKTKGDKAVIFNVLRLSSCTIGLIMSKMFNIKTVGVVTDVPGYRIKFGKDNLFNKFCDKYAQFLLTKYDSYVFLSEEMKKVIPVCNKPHVIIEGVFDTTSIKTTCSQHDLNKIPTIMYAGSLHYKYGIMNLVNAVIEMNANVKLEIYGKGESEKELIDLSKKYECICYIGIKDHDYILEREQQVDVLINPRPVEEEYVKFSFPSKVMEYMASGTPFIQTKIQSLPQEYEDYLYLIDTNSIEEIKSALTSVLFQNQYDLYLEKANKARSFIINEKNQKMQASKLCSLI